MAGAISLNAHPLGQTFRTAADACPAAINKRAASPQTHSACLTAALPPGESRIVLLLSPSNSVVRGKAVRLPQLLGVVADLSPPRIWNDVKPEPNRQKGQPRAIVSRRRRPSGNRYDVAGRPNPHRRGSRRRVINANYTGL